MANFSAAPHINSSSAGLGPIVQRGAPREPYRQSPYPEREPGVLEKGLAGFGQGLGQGFEKGLQKQLQRQSVQKLLEMKRSNPDLDPLEELNFLAEADPALRPHLTGIFKREAEAKAEADKQAQKHKYDLELEGMKSKAENSFQRKMGEKKADLVSTAYEDGSRLAGSADSLKRLREQVSSVTGSASNLYTKGYAKSIFGSEDAQEFNNLGTATTKPILEIFNPTGQLPVAKMMFIVDNYAPKAGDTERTMKGKLNALDRLHEQATKRVKKITGLYEQYGENFPLDELAKIQAEDTAVLDKAFKEAEQLNKHSNKSTGKGPRFLNKTEEIQRPDLPQVQGKVRYFNPQTGEAANIDQNNQNDIQEAIAEGFEPW